MERAHRRDEAQWQEIIDEQEQSGLTARAFCEKREIGLASFYAWRKRLAEVISSARKKRAEEFIELDQAGLGETRAHGHPTFEAVLDLGGGISITLRRG